MWCDIVKDHCFHIDFLSGFLCIIESGVLKYLNIISPFIFPFSFISLPYIFRCSDVWLSPWMVISIIMQCLPVSLVTGFYLKSILSDISNVILTLLFNFSMKCLFPSLCFQPVCLFKSKIVQFSHSVVSDSLRFHGLQHATLPCLL